MIKKIYHILICIILVTTVLVPNVYSTSESIKFNLNEELLINKIIIQEQNKCFLFNSTLDDNFKDTSNLK